MKNTFNCFWTRLDELVEHFEELGFEVVAADRECIEIVDADEQTFLIRLGGTERTIIVIGIEQL